MTIRRIPSGSPFETRIGYCRAVVAGGWVHVAGTVGEGVTAAEQCQSALRTIEQALLKAGAGFSDVVARYLHAARCRRIRKLLAASARRIRRCAARSHDDRMRAD